MRKGYEDSPPIKAPPSHDEMGRGSMLRRHQRCMGRERGTYTPQ